MIDPESVVQLLKDQERAGGQQPRDFMLVDARRTDCTGGTIRGSMNLPAHSFYSTRKTLYDLCKQAGIRKIIFYCGEWGNPKNTCPLAPFLSRLLMTTELAS